MSTSSTLSVLRYFFLLSCLAVSSLRGEPRELSADRPDTTESPFSVEPGRVQVESTLAGWSRDKISARETWTLVETNFKLGLTPNFDVQLVAAPLVFEREELAGAVTEREGLGDFTLRGKWNLWGNDGGDTAFGLLPHLTIPTGTEVSGNTWEAGLVTPFAWELSERFSLGSQVEIATASEDAGRYACLSHTVVLGGALTDCLGCYVEYAGTASRQPYEAYFSTGVTLGLSDDMQWDAGLLAGLNDPAEDLALFTGLTVRF